MDSELSGQELQMLQMIREWSGKDYYRLVLEHRDGAWEIELSIPEQKKTARGVGDTFDKAWDNMDPTWA
jgi:hypothetical protein